MSSEQTTRILVAHGTADVQGQATIEQIVEVVAAQTGPIRLAWLDVVQPTLAQVLSTVPPGTEVVIVPLLLSAGFHDQTDIPAVVAATAPHAVVAPVLGADPRLIEALAGRLIEAGWAGEPVVLGGTGSARADWHQLAGQVAVALGQRLGTVVELGVLTGPGTRVADALTDLSATGIHPRRSNAAVAVSAYLLAEGFFHDRLRTAADTVIAAPIGPHAKLIDLLVERFVSASVSLRHMATTAFQGNPVQTVGDLPAKGSPAPDFVVTGADLSEIKLSDFKGTRVVLNIFPSIDTGVCAMSVRKFNELAAGLDNTTVLCVSADLPFALGRFCGAEGIDNVSTGSVFRSSFGADYGVAMADGPLQGLLARSVVVLDVDGMVLHSELVPEITQEPDYDAATGVLS